MLTGEGDREALAAAIEGHWWPAGCVVPDRPSNASFRIADRVLAAGYRRVTAKPVTFILDGTTYWLEPGDEVVITTPNHDRVVGDVLNAVFRRAGEGDQ